MKKIIIFLSILFIITGVFGFSGEVQAYSCPGGYTDKGGGFCDTAISCGSWDDCAGYGETMGTHCYSPSCTDLGGLPLGMSGDFGNIGRIGTCWVYYASCTKCNSSNQCVIGETGQDCNPDAKAWGACDWTPCNPALSSTNPRGCPNPPECTSGNTMACDSAGGTKTCINGQWGPCSGLCNTPAWQTNSCNGQGMQGCTSGACPVCSGETEITCDFHYECGYASACVKVNTPGTNTCTSESDTVSCTIAPVAGAPSKSLAINNENININQDNNINQKNNNWYGGFFEVPTVNATTWNALALAGDLGPIAQAGGWEPTVNPPGCTITCADPVTGECAENNILSPEFKCSGNGILQKHIIDKKSPGKCDLATGFCVGYPATGCDATTLCPDYCERIIKWEQIDSCSGADIPTGETRCKGGVVQEKYLVSFCDSTRCVPASPGPGPDKSLCCGLNPVWKTKQICPACAPSFPYCSGSNIVVDYVGKTCFFNGVTASCQPAVCTPLSLPCGPASSYSIPMCSGGQQCTLTVTNPGTCTTVGGTPTPCSCAGQIASCGPGGSCVCTGVGTGAQQNTVCTVGGSPVCAGMTVSVVCNGPCTLPPPPPPPPCRKTCPDGSSIPCNQNCLPCTKVCPNGNTIACSVDCGECVVGEKLACAAGGEQNCGLIGPWDQICTCTNGVPCCSPGSQNACTNGGYQTCDFLGFWGGCECLGASCCTPGTRQRCPGGGYQFCDATSLKWGSCNCIGSKMCADGSMISCEQNCPVCVPGTATKTCPNGVTVDSCNACPICIFGTATKTCPNGVVVDACGICTGCTTQTCPDGTVVCNSTPCPECITQTCPGGVVICASASCPVCTPGPTKTCPDGVVVDICQTCPTCTTQTCPNKSVICATATCPVCETKTCANGSVICATATCPVCETKTCANGSVICATATCPVCPFGVATQTCPNGVVVDACDVCPTCTTQTCPNGSKICSTGTCSNCTTQTCPDGSKICTTGICPTCTYGVATKTCPNGVVVDDCDVCPVCVTQPCPNGTLICTTGTCSNCTTQTCPDGSKICTPGTCPKCTTKTCPNGSIVPCDQACPVCTPIWTYTETPCVCGFKTVNGSNNCNSSTTSEVQSCAYENPLISVGDWSACIDGYKSRISKYQCTGNLTETQTCEVCVPVWTYTETPCICGSKTVTGTNSCTGETTQPQQQSCTYAPTETCSNWSSCVSSLESRTCVNSCTGTRTETRPCTTSKCTPEKTCSLTGTGPDCTYDWECNFGSDCNTNLCKCDVVPIYGGVTNCGGTTGNDCNCNVTSKCDTTTCQCTTTGTGASCVDSTACLNAGCVPQTKCDTTTCQCTLTGTGASCVDSTACLNSGCVPQAKCDTATCKCLLTGTGSNCVYSSDCLGSGCIPQTKCTTSKTCSLQGSGSPCTFDSECWFTHNECLGLTGEECIPVSTPGTDTCNDSIDQFCQAKTFCGADQTCSKFGNGKECLTPLDCVIPTKCNSACQCTTTGTGTGCDVSILNDCTVNKTCVPFCTENWNCGNWSTCLNGMQTRACTDLAECGTENEKPNEFSVCHNACNSVSCETLPWADPLGIGDWCGGTTGLNCNLPGKCTIEKTCSPLGTGDDCLETIDCNKPKFHNECEVKVGGGCSCVEKAGDSIDQCALGSNCTASYCLKRNVCTIDKKCVAVDCVEGESCVNDCDSDAMCVEIPPVYHGECAKVGEACKCNQVLGDTISQCLTDASCSTSSICLKKNVCVGQACTSQDCTNVNECNSNCDSTTNCCPQGNYTRCVDGKCICTFGTEVNNCSTDQDCSTHNECSKVFRGIYGGLWNIINDCVIINGQSDNSCDFGNICPLINSTPPFVSNIIIDSGDYCTGVYGSGLINISWKYNQDEGKAEKLFKLQVDDNPDFTSLAVDIIIDGRSTESGETESQTIFVKSEATQLNGDYITYGTEYYWRIMVQDVGNVESAWTYFNLAGGTINIDIAGKQKFLYPHAPPFASFAISPEKPLPGDNIYFTNLSMCYGPSGCASYSWNFNDGSPLKSTKNAEYIYTLETKPYPVTTLNVCDDSGQGIKCCPGNKTIPVSTLSGQNLPYFKEIPPQ